MNRVPRLVETWFQRLLGRAAVLPVGLVLIFPTVPGAGMGTKSPCKPGFESGSAGWIADAEHRREKWERDSWDTAAGTARATAEQSPGPWLRCDIPLCTPCHHHARPGTWICSPVLAPASVKWWFGGRAPHVWQPQRKSTLMKCFPAVIGFPL